jgi:hypothetical protein
LRLFLDIFCTAYLNNILIYSETLYKYKKHVRSVLNALREARLQLDVNKCEFHQTEVTYLSYVVRVDGIQINPKKV